MAVDIWERVLPMARSVRHVFLPGFGEPLIHPECLALLRQLNRCRVSTHLVTNGTLLTPRLSANLARIRHLFRVNVSLDTADADTYRAMRGGDHHRALDGLFLEQEVNPGGTATFEFRVQPSSRAEEFELVKEGVCWFPRTRVSLGPVPSWSNPLRSAWWEIRYRLADLGHWWVHGIAPRWRRNAHPPAR